MSIPYAEVIGDPIVHSKSPTIHRFWLGRLGVAGDYCAVRVGPDELPAYLEARRGDPDWRGCNVTMPLKEVAWKLIDHSDPATRRIGALNTIVRQESGLIGVNTDWQAINLALGTGRHDLRRAAIVGTGGAARAALEEMRQAKVGQVDLISRSGDKALALLQEFGLAGEVLPLGGAPEADLLINASPLGMAGHSELPIDLSRLRPGAIVFDMVYAPVETRLIGAARSRGLRTIDGLTMLIGQASMAFTFFFAKTPEPADTPELRSLLTS